MSLARFRLTARNRIALVLCIAVALVGVRAYRNYRLKQSLAAIHRMGAIVHTTKQGTVRRVHLQGDRFNDNSLETLVSHLIYLRDLTELDLVQCPVTDAGLLQLSKLETLEELYLFETTVTDAGPAQLQKELPQLAIKHEMPDPVASSKVSQRIYRHAINSIAMRPDERQLVAGNGSGDLLWWNVATMDAPLTIQAHSDWLFATAFSADGKLLATGGGDNLIRLWNSQTKRSIGTIEVHHDDVHAIAFSHDGSTLFSASDDMTVRRIDLELGKDKAILKTDLILGRHHDTVPCLAISPDGQMVASGSRDDTIGLWNSNGGAIRLLTGHTDDVYTLAFSPDGKTLASGSYDGTVRIWDPATGETIRSLVGHKGRIFSVAFSSDSETVVSGGEDGVIVWDVAVKEPRRKHPHITNASCIRFRPGEQELVVSDTAGCIRFIHAPSGQLARRLETSRLFVASRRH